MGDITRKEFNDLKKDFEAFKKTSSMGKAIKKTRKPSEFNLFVGKTIKDIKVKNPNIEHKLAFSQAVSMWNDQKNKS